VEKITIGENVLRRLRFQRLRNKLAMFYQRSSIGASLTSR